MHSPIYHTCFLLGYTSELFGFLFQLLRGTPQLSGDSSQLLGLAPWLLGLAPQLLGRSRQLLGQDPLLYSRSRVLDSARSRSCQAFWMFLSERFIASLSFSFSSARDSILFISWRCCSATRVISCKQKMTVSLSNSKHQPGPFQA